MVQQRTKRAAYDTLEEGPSMEDTLTIGAMCKAYDVTPRTLRFYEAKELLFPIREGQKRYFTRSDQARLKLILRGKRFGFSLEEIRQLLDMYNREDRGGTQLMETVRQAQERHVAMVTQREELEEAITDLQKQIDWGLGEMQRRGIDPQNSQ